MPLPHFKLERYFARYEFTTEHLLCASDCESMTIAELLDHEPGAQAAFQEHWLGYTESPGDPSLRDTIAELYDSIGRDDILVHSGAEEAIFTFANSLLEPGDHVIVHSPCYQSLREVARAAGAAVTDWPADPEDGWQLDPDHLKASLRPTTRAVLINCPHNPTGYHMARERFDAVIEIARHHGLLLFSDEVYRGLEHDPADRLPAACDHYERGVSLGVMSKTYGLAGLRIGWVATHDRDLLTKMAAFKDYLTICNSAPSEFLARVALNQRARITAGNLRILLDNLALLDGFFDRHAERFQWQRPRAGPIAFPALRAGGADAFCRDLVERAQVLLVPASVFDAGNRHFRIGFGRRTMAEALARFDDHLSV